MKRLLLDQNLHKYVSEDVFVYRVTYLLNGTNFGEPEKSTHEAYTKYVRLYARNTYGYSRLMPEGYKAYGYFFFDNEDDALMFSLRVINSRRIFIWPSIILFTIYENVDDECE